MTRESIEAGKVVPIYAFHHSSEENERRMDSFMKAWANNTKPGEVHMWDAEAVQKVRELRPRVLGIDSLSTSFQGWRDIYTMCPENPFNMRWDNKDTFIVAGDTSNQMILTQDEDLENAIEAEFGHRSNLYRDLETYYRRLAARNATLTYKVLEASERLSQTEWDDGPLAALWGSEHKVIPFSNYHCLEEERRKSLIPSIFNIFQTATHLYLERDNEPFINLPPSKVDIIKTDLAKFLSSTIIWRISDGNSEEVNDTLMKIIFEDQFQSRSIELLVDEVAQNYFQFDPRALFAYQEQWATLPPRGGL